MHDCMMMKMEKDGKDCSFFLCFISFIGKRIRVISIMKRKRGQTVKENVLKTIVKEIYLREGLKHA